MYRATDKSEVTTTLDTEINYLPVFSLHLVGYQPNLLDSHLFFLSICFHSAKIVLLSIKRAILKAT
jgi:hypothetical protein